MTEIPVRCMTCGSDKPNRKWPAYQKDLQAGLTQTEALDKSTLTRICCRTMLLCHVDLSERLLRFQAMENRSLHEIDYMTFNGDEAGDDSGDEN